jgi:hypothetical protein
VISARCARCTGSKQQLKKVHPEIAVSRGSLERWSRMHDWANHVKAHDGERRAQGVMMQPARRSLPGPEFDQIGALLSAAN